MSPPEMAASGFEERGQIEAAEVKARISLRALFERDGHVFKRSGADLVCLSPFVTEKSPSCHVHEKEGFFMCFSTGLGGDCFTYMEATRHVDFKAALEALASIAGLSGGGPLLPPIIRPPKAEVVELASPLAGEDLERWTAAVARLKESPAEQERIAAWRGYTPATVHWAVERDLMGLVEMYGQMREAFVVERPCEGGGLLPIAFHVRLGPNTPGNPDQRASWRYSPAGVGGWPLVIGRVSTAQIIYACEGQWDALAVVDLMPGWVETWPEGVAVVAMRGTSNWKRFAESFTWPTSATLFALCQSDVAGMRWVTEKEGFLNTVWKRFFRVHGFYSGQKDWNDLLKAKGVTGHEFAKMFRREMRRVGRKAKGQTFLAWCQATASKEAAVSAAGDGALSWLGLAAQDVVADKARPKRRKSLAVWERHWDRRGVTGELRKGLREAWASWKGSLS